MPNKKRYTNGLHGPTRRRSGTQSKCPPYEPLLSRRCHRQWAELEPHLRSGALDPLISETFPLEDAGRALARIDERRVTGKVVLEI